MGSLKDGKSGESREKEPDNLQFERVFHRKRRSEKRRGNDLAVSTGSQD